MNKCSECEKTFGRLTDLRRHCKKFHNEKSGVIAPLKRQQRQYKYTCACGKKFNHNKNLNAHKRTHHASDETVTSTSSSYPSRTIKFKKCPLCAYENKMKSEMYKHLQMIHNIPISVRKLEFSTVDDFEQWKNIFKKNSKSNFIKNRGVMSKKSTREIHYYCHRSGIFISESNRLRCLKTQGSNKINGFCPAEMKVLFHENGKCQLTLTETHVGHMDNDLGHLSLTASERQSIAVKIASKIPFSSILEEVRDHVTSDTLKRLDLLTKKDLYNIEAAFNLKSSSVRHQNDAISVEAWVNEMREGNSCVLFYKPQDTVLLEYPDLKTSDFVLCIMNEGQTHVLQQFCNDCICIDGTHGLNKYNFEIHTLLVLDDLRQGFPCGFLISNRSDLPVLQLFFQAIKDHIGVTIKPKVYMSHMADVYYNAWIKVMDKPDHRLFCTWHVLRAWNKNLSFICSKDKQQEINTQLRTLLEETDSMAFHRMLHNFLIQTSNDPETLDFSKYFKDNYSRNYTFWAYCYRLHCGLNTNMQLERMHKTIKYVYCSGKNVKRLDKIIGILMTFVRDKLYDRIIMLPKGKISSKLADLRLRHNTSKNLTNTICEGGENTWEIQSTRKFEVYIIQKENIKCDCPLRCEDCKICIHQYSCSCLDSAVKWNMCKHIHLLCTYLNPKSIGSTETIGTGDGEDNLAIHCDLKHTECEDLLKTLSVNSKKKEASLDDKKDKMRSHFNKILDNISTKSEMEALERLVAPIEATILAVSQASSSALGTNSESEKFAKIPANKKIIPQRRLYSTNRTSKSIKKKIEKPSHEDQNKLAAALLNNKRST